MPESYERGDDNTATESSIVSRRLLSPYWTRIFTFVLPIAGLIIGGVIYLAASWSLWAALEFTVAILAVLVAFLVLSAIYDRTIANGRFTWMRLARKPSIAMHRGDSATAERAYQGAIERARKFSPNDKRRGVMLCELARFAQHQGRHQEALALFDESVNILAHIPKWDIICLIHRANALLSYSHCYGEIRDFESSQRILERLSDMVFVAERADELVIVRAVDPILRSFEAILRWSIAYLLMETGELASASRHLDEAAAVMESLPRRYQQHYCDSHRRAVAYLEILSGNFLAAEEQLVNVHDSTNPSTQAVRAKLHLKRLEYAEAEKSLRLFQKNQTMLGNLHRPGLLETTLDLADALFHQSKNDDAFASFEEARAIVADFALPADGAWRKALATWLQRAKDLGRTELAASLEQELAKASATPVQAITILDKFRIRPRAAE